MTPSAITDAPARGRRRDDARDPEILAAALAVLADVGYDRLTMDAVASRARAGKATLYRRWDSKAELIVEAVTTLDDACAIEIVDTGSLRSDLLAMLQQVPSDRGDSRMCVMRGLVSCLPHDPELKAAFERTFVQRRQAEIARAFVRARERGELAHGVDIELLVDVVPAMVFFRILMTSKPVDAGFVESLIDQVVLPLTRPATS